MVAGRRRDTVRCLFLSLKYTEKGIKSIDNIPKKVYNDKCKEDKKQNKHKVLERRKGGG